MLNSKFLQKNLTFIKLLYKIEMLMNIEEKKGLINFIIEKTWLYL